MDGGSTKSQGLSAGLLAAGMLLSLAIAHGGGHHALPTPTYKVDIALRVKSL